MLSVARDRPVPRDGRDGADILLVGVFGLEAGRGTRDVDLAIAIDSRRSRRGWDFEWWARSAPRPAG